MYSKVTLSFHTSVGNESIILLFVCHTVKENIEAFKKCSVRVLNLIKYTVHFIKSVLEVWRNE